MAITPTRWGFFSGTSATQSTSTAVNIGETVLVWVYATASATISTPTGGGTYVLLATRLNGTFRMSMYGLLAATANATAVSSTISASVEAGIMMGVYTGVVSFGQILDVAASGAQSVSAVLQEADNYLVAGASYNTGSLVTITTGNSRGTDSDATVGAGIGDNTAATAISVTVAFGGTGTGIVQATELRLAAAGGAATKVVLAENGRRILLESGQYLLT